MKEMEIFKDNRVEVIIPTLGILVADGHRIPATIPVGAVITIVTSRPDEEGLLLVEWEGKIAMIYVQDLMERGELVRQHGQG